MFNKILIANRGEIALRVICACKDLGIRTVAVYSEADRHSLHTRFADEAICIGPAKSSRSYLDIPAVISAAEITNAEAVHPGYGFLSENADFAEVCETSGLTFIGPKPEVIRRMGLKQEARTAMDQACVPILPGSKGVLGSVEEALEVAAGIGYPVMMKASAGGGGRGMRVVRSAEELPQLMAQAQNEAAAAFSNGDMYMEKLVENPRHIEFQILADNHGNVEVLGERECSIQRRHQKVIEEAPSPFLDAKTRAAMGAQAVALAKAVGYDSAGTVEFIVDGQRNFYFLEMNTRLQVEHPVTELITGLDLVELMIRSAAGEKLPLAQKDVTIHGWAVESRVYAEDPYRGFLPSTGRLTRYHPPREGKESGVTVRNDTGVFEGGEISVYYDPMIAKLSTHAATREAAMDGMAAALDRFEISGIAHNVSFLNAIMDNPRFREGRLTTGFIAEEFPEGFKGAPLPDGEGRLFVAAAVAAKLARTQRASRISGALNGALKPGDSFVVTAGDRDFAVCDAYLAVGTLRLAIDGKIFEAIVDWFPGRSLLLLKHGGHETVFQIARHAGGYRLIQGGRDVLVSVRAPYAARLAALMPLKAALDTSRFLLCPMPGLITALPVSAGQDVKAGDALATVEAMKMENVLYAERDGVIAKVLAKKGDNLARDDVILEFQ